jgi:hypothetical protein
MEYGHKIELLSKIGKDFVNVCNEVYDNSFPGFEKINNHNPWFTPEFVKFALSQWSQQLTDRNLDNWLSKYNFNHIDTNPILGLIMAGNIPLVGFHDLICGIVSDFKINIKLSSKDNLLMKWVIERICTHNPELKKSITYSEDKLCGFDAIIATGSNNTNRYFEYYFGNYPNILRHNRNSVAVLTGDETIDELEKLADDVLLYFGLGCRSISKLYLPEHYNFNEMGKAFHKYYYLIDHYKYANNFDYQYALIAMNQVERVNFENLLLIERKELFSPVAVINFEYYTNIENVKNDLILNENKIQCVVCKNRITDKNIGFGDSQKPKITEYADNIDTIKFLLNFKNHDYKI